MQKQKCGHYILDFTCDLNKGHKGLHAQRTKLRDHVETTNWGDDGLAPWATKYPENGSYGRYLRVTRP